MNLLKILRRSTNVVYNKFEKLIRYAIQSRGCFLTYIGNNVKNSVIGVKNIVSTPLASGRFYV